MPEIVNLPKQTNQDAVALLEDTIEKVRAGEVEAVSIAWTTHKGGIGGVFSSHKNGLTMWAAIEHAARQFYRDVVLGDDE